MTLLVLLTSFLILKTAYGASLDDFLAVFFKDTTFQIQHINFPLKETVRFISSTDDSTVELDTIFPEKPKDWECLTFGFGRPNVSYDISDNIPTSLSGTANLMYLRLEEEETDFNLDLRFLKKESSWVLVFMSFFVPYVPEHQVT